MDDKIEVTQELRDLINATFRDVAYILNKLDFRSLRTTHLERNIIFAFTDAMVEGDSE